MVGAKRVAQAALTVQDLERAKAFYRDALGLQHLFDAPPALSFFQCGETRLMLSEADGGEGESGTILYYGVEDVDSACAAASAGGAVFEEGPRTIARIEEKDIRLAIGRDGEGNMFGLISG